MSCEYINLQYGDRPIQREHKTGSSGCLVYIGRNYVKVSWVQVIERNSIASRREEYGPCLFFASSDEIDATYIYIV